MGFLPIDLTGIVPAEDFPSYAPGDYLLQIKKVEMKTVKSGESQYMAIQSTILQGPEHSMEYQGKAYSHNMFLVGKTPETTKTILGFFLKFCCACGLKELIEQNGNRPTEEMFVGRTYIAKVEKGEKYHETSRYRPGAQWTHGAVQAAAAPQSALLQPVAAAAPPTAPAPQQQMQQPVVQPVVQPVAITPQPAVQPVVMTPAPAAAPQGVPVPQGVPALQAVPQPAVQPQAGMLAPPPPASIPGQG